MTSESRRLLAGRFVLDTRIGAGNYAEIFRATDTETGELVAVKTLRPEHTSEQQAISLFKQEGAAGSVISHRNVVRIRSHGEEQGTHFIVMELIKGISLRRRMTLAGRLSIHESLRIITAVLRGLEAIHGAGYIHRDIKPQNILIDADGTPKITDFGIMLSPGEARRGGGGLALGTAAYIAPEQAAGQDIGEQADIYSAGAVLFEMLAGEAPFPGDDPLDVMNRHLFEPPRDPRTLNPEVSPALAAIVLRALAKEPAARFASAQRMREALEMLDPDTVQEPPRMPRRPAEAMAWTVPLGPSHRFPTRLGGVPILTTVVSALLLVVLIIVLVLAFVSSVVTATPGQNRISSSGLPSGMSGTPMPNTDPPQSPNQTQSVMHSIPDWTVSAALSSPTPTATAVATTSPMSTKIAQANTTPMNETSPSQMASSTSVPPSRTLPSQNPVIELSARVREAVAALTAASKHALPAKGDDQGQQADAQTSNGQKNLPKPPGNGAATNKQSPNPKSPSTGPGQPQSQSGQPSTSSASNPQSGHGKGNGAKHHRDHD